jgi:hypothetical protein
MASGFHLATHIQLKMALNSCCSPDLSNDRRQNDVAGNRNLNNDGVGLTPSIGQISFIQGLRSKLLCPRDSLARSSARNRSPSSIVSFDLNLL